MSGRRMHVIYLRIIFCNGDILTRFVALESRVAPIKKVTIPRLELMACLTLSCLMKAVTESFMDYKVNSYCWTVSTDCIYWINS